jgi:ubiquinol-cytochrome c reductase cytochrome c1 subunit
MKILSFLAAALFASTAHAAEHGPQLDRAPIDLNDKPSLQRGAAIFVNHCLNCHSANVMRYGRLEDIGLTEEQIRDNLLFTADKVGDTMSTALDTKLAKTAFALVPPDLSLIARSRSPDWIYTYLRGFYRDPNSKTGWNNTVFHNVAMPNVLWEYQGDQVLEVTERQDPNSGDKIESQKLVLERPGKLSRVEYDRYVGDLVNYLTYMSEPGQTSRRLWGILVMFFLAGFFIVSLLLKKEYWKDVK